MARFTSVVEVAASAQDAFDFLRDPCNRSAWDPSVRDVAARDGACGEVGDRYDVTVGFYGKAIEAVYEIDELAAPGRIVFAADGKVRGRDVIEITERDGGSTVSLDLTVNLKGPARLLDRGLQVAFAGIGENAVAGVKRELEKAR